MKARILVIILIILFAFPLITGCTKDIAQIKEKMQNTFSKGPVSVEETTICKKVDKNNAPIEPTTTFPSGTTAIYLSVEVKNFTPKDKLTVTWNYLETGEEINTSEFTTEQSGSGYIGFNITIAEGFPSGKYNAKVYLNDELIETKEFSVK